MHRSFSRLVSLRYRQTSHWSLSHIQTLLAFSFVSSSRICQASAHSAVAPPPWARCVNWIPFCVALCVFFFPRSLNPSHRHIFVICKFKTFDVFFLFDIACPAHMYVLSVRLQFSITSSFPAEKSCLYSMRIFSFRVIAFRSEYCSVVDLVGCGSWEDPF